MIRLVEYTTSEVRLEGRDLHYLLRLVKGTGEPDEARIIQAITPTAADGLYHVRPGGFVGRLGLPSGDWIDIHSRFPFEDVIELIRQSGRLPLRVDRKVVPAGAEPFVVDVIAAAFTREVDRLVSGGLAKGYQRRRFERPPYPGQIDVNRHLGRYAARPDRLVTSAKRITHDIDINRALALALDVLQRVRMSARLAHQTATLGPSFVRVGRAPMSPAAIGRIPLTRLTARYETALALAELILGSRVLAPREEQFSGASVLFNMPKVWESFVARWVEERWGLAYRVKGPYAFALTSDGVLRSEADVTVWDGDELVALYDAKYKWPGTTPSMGDVYQMVTYCQRLGIHEATLVYPAPTEEKTFTIRDVRVRMMGLSVGVNREVRGVAMKGAR